MTDRSSATTPPTHDTHDLERIVALAARDADLDPTVADAARAQVTACRACRDLLADVVALSAAVPDAAIPARPRDYTLTEADALRLRPGGWRRLLGFVGSARDGFTRPLAIGLTTIGLAGLLVATLPGALGGLAIGSGGAAALSTVGSAISPAAPSHEAGSIAASAAPALPAPASAAAPAASGEPPRDAAGEGGTFSGAGDGTTSQRADQPSDLAAEAAIGEDATGMSVLAVLAGAILIVGLGLFGLRWTARRLGDG
ncbi:MAG TPA: hypothetical protein VFI69_03515 [Candidatus Limnocylindrales bacterium]|jgi:hypothetical protein|nr:hypothetical protein [Candidatus Limnocylindrales bacterium]